MIENTAAKRVTLREKLWLAILRERCREVKLRLERRFWLPGHRPKHAWRQDAPVQAAAPAFDSGMVAMLKVRARPSRALTGMCEFSANDELLPDVNFSGPF